MKQLIALMILFLPATACKKKEQPPAALTTPAAPAAPTSPPAPAAPRARVDGVCADKPEKRLATKRTSGQFGGFEVGDYVYVLIGKPGGETASYWAPVSPVSEPILNFLVAHPKKTIALEYDVLDSCIEEAGGYQRIERLRSAAIDGLTAQAWWQDLQNNPAAVQRIQEQTERLMAPAEPKPAVGRTGQDGAPLSIGSRSKHAR